MYGWLLIGNTSYRLAGEFITLPFASTGSAGPQPQITNIQTPSDSPRNSTMMTAAITSNILSFLIRQ